MIIIIKSYYKLMLVLNIKIIIFDNGTNPNKQSNLL